MSPSDNSPPIVSVRLTLILYFSLCLSVRRYELQRLKPINEPMLEQITYYCVMNYPELHSSNNCPGFNINIQLNQGSASDWLAKEGVKYKQYLEHQVLEYDKLML